MRGRWAVLPGVMLGVGAGCTASLRGPNLGAIYHAAAQFHDEHRNPVIVIPGILGSKLIEPESGRVVWGAFSGDYANPQTPDGARLLALPMGEGAALRDLRDEIVPDGVLDRVKVSLLGLPLELGAYVQVLATLGVGGYRDELLGKVGAVDYGELHYTCFQFDYDWRRDLVESAARLDQFIRERRAYVQAELRKRYGVENADVKFDIVAHSMGGLVARYYLQYGDADLPAEGIAPSPNWAGARYVERAILVGTPNAGSIKALAQLVNGASFAPIVPSYPPAVLGTMPAVYQLLPRARHASLVDAAAPQRPLDPLDPELWEQMGWGLASPRQEKVLGTLLPGVADADTRRRIARDHLRKCLTRTRRLHEALDVPASPPAGLDLYLFAGDAEPTDDVASVDPQSGRLRVVQQSPGDGTVTRSSALMDERTGGSWRPGLRSPIDWRGVNFVFTDHLGMTRDPAFSDNVLFLLLDREHAAHAW